VTWDSAALDAWITNPQAFIPGNRMPFRGIPDQQARADIIAFLAAPTAEQAMSRGGMMGGMMGGGDELHELTRELEALAHTGPAAPPTAPPPAADAPGSAAAH